MAIYLGTPDRATSHHDEAFLLGALITPLPTASTHIQPDPQRTRKLLLHKRELKKLIGKLQEKGLALIPLSIYFKENGRAKIELGLARGKRQYDKRAALKQKQSDREVQRAMRRNQHN